MPLLELLRLQVAVDGGDDGDQPRDRAAQRRHPTDDPGDDGHDAFVLLPNHEVADTAGGDEVEYQDEDRIFRRLLRLDEGTAAGRGGRRRGRGRSGWHVAHAVAP